MQLSDSIVIIPTYNERENIENIIRAVFGLDKPMKNITICENTVTIKSTYKDENQEAINQLIEEICH